METNNSQLVIYQTPQGDTRIDVRVKGDTIWLTQRQIADLFGTKVPAISKHLKNIFASGELQEDMVISKMETTTRHGAIAGKTQTTETNFYNLDAILSVGYRVNSKNATAFRIWANQVLKQYLLQGYAINERVAAQKYDELSQLVKVLGRTIQNQEKLTEEKDTMVKVIVNLINKNN
ncbi:MAG: virulence RhuM family protein [Duncaniella sp.]|nr:virulence RhuM family protein [Duncaniella sp.]